MTHMSHKPGTPNIQGPQFITETGIFRFTAEGACRIYALVLKANKVLLNILAPAEKDAVCP